jgi:hypothetical protein
MESDNRTSAVLLNRAVRSCEAANDDFWENDMGRDLEVKTESSAKRLNVAVAQEFRRGDAGIPGVAAHHRNQ